MFRKILGMSALVLSTMSTAPASPMPIVGVTATTNMGEGFNTRIDNIVDGSGLITYLPNGSKLQTYSPAAWHERGVIGNAWGSNAGITSGKITFNFHGNYDIPGLAVWNTNAANIWGVKDVTIYKSINGIDFLPLLGAPDHFKIGKNGGSGESPDELAEIFSFTDQVASFIRFDIHNNYGGIGISLSEVMFLGSPAPIPVPGAAWLFGSGLLGVLGFKRRSNIG